MNRRESLKAIGITTLSATLLLDACKPKEKENNKAAVIDKETDADRQPIEADRDKKLKSETFFTPHEMATILCWVILLFQKMTGRVVHQMQECRNLSSLLLKICHNIKHQ